MSKATLKIYNARRRRNNDMSQRLEYVVILVGFVALVALAIFKLNAWFVLPY